MRKRRCRRATRTDLTSAADRPMPSGVLDCAIIGGGAAGLTAATYLARFHRRIAVLDGGGSRLLSVPTSHNLPGYVSGIHGKDLLARLQAQLAGYGLTVTTCTVNALERAPEGYFVARAGEHAWTARMVLLATGVVDVEPALPEVKQAVANGMLRYCPICDGFEATGRKVAVIGRGKGGLGEALFVSHYTRDIALYSVTEPIVPDAEELRRAGDAGLRIVREPVARLEYADAGITLRLHDGSGERHDVLYSALGTMVNSGLAQLLGADRTDDGMLLVDSHQQTTVDGLYAAGDIVAGLNQITVAMGQAAVAATAIHNRLREE